MIDQNAAEIHLFSKIAEGDESAFSELFHFYIPEITPVISGIVVQKEVVKDIVQEVFLRIWLNRSELPHIQSPRAWIFKIVYFQSFNWLRQQRTREKYTTNFSASGKHNNPQNTPDTEVSFAETSRLVREAIENLPPQAKKIYRLSRDGGMNTTEIAKALELSPQTVKNTISRSLQGIRDYLKVHDIIVF